MTIAELNIQITGDDTSAQEAIRRTTVALRQAQKASDELATALSNTMKAQALGPEVSRQMAAYYGAELSTLKELATQKSKDVQLLERQLTLLQQAKEIAKGEDAAMHQAKLKNLLAQAGGPLDVESIKLYGKMFDDLAPRSQEFIRQLQAINDETARLAIAGPPAWVTAVTQAYAAAKQLIAQKASDLRQQVATDFAAFQAALNPPQRLSNMAQINQQLKGSLQGVDPMIAAILRAQAKQVDELQNPGGEFAGVGSGIFSAYTKQIQDGELATNKLKASLANLKQGIAQTLGVAAPWDSIIQSLGVDTGKLTDEQKKLLNEIARTAEIKQQVELLTKSLRDGIGSTLSQLYQTGFKHFFASVLGGFEQMLRKMSQEWLQSVLMTSIMKGLGGLFGNIFSTGGDSGWHAPMTLPGRAAGGAVDAGAAYWVGERGPELFFPKTSGYVASAQTSHSLIGGTTIHNHFNIATPNADSFRRSLGQIAAETGIAIQRGLQRNG
ncbi:MAG: hypothetical protein JSS72_01910 [Armatimonadetes bacterium]|nr:hypothetical protein [Armatimonadota bacterium]